MTERFVVVFSFVVVVVIIMVPLGVFNFLSALLKISSAGLHTCYTKIELRNCSLSYVNISVLYK